MMQYKGYLARVEFGDEANIFHWEVINTRDVIALKEKSAEELKKALEDSIGGIIVLFAKNEAKNRINPSPNV